MDRFARRLDALRSPGLPATLDAQWDIGGFRLAVRLTALSETGCLRYRFGKLRAKDYLDLWLLLQREDIAFTRLPDLICAKLDVVGFPYTPQILWEEADVLSRVWSDDLRQLMRDVPPFETMFGQLHALFEERMPKAL